MQVIEAGVLFAHYICFKQNQYGAIFSVNNMVISQGPDCPEDFGPIGVRMLTYGSWGGIKFSDLRLDIADHSVHESELGCFIARMEGAG